MFADGKKLFYSLNLDDFADKVRGGQLEYLPHIVCVFGESSDYHKYIAAKVLNEILKGLSWDEIYKTDKLMRERTSMEWYIDWYRLRIEDLLTADMSENERRTVLIFASFNPNGYIREQAVKELGKYKDTLPFILLRCNDWVYEVCQAALNLALEKLPYAKEEEIIHLLPVMEKLKRSEGDGYHNIFPAILDVFQNNRNLFRKGLCSKDVRARRFCLSLIRNLDQTDYNYLMDYLPQEKEPFLRKIIFQILADNGEDPLESARHFLKDKYPQNRMMALQYLDKHKNDYALPAAITMLVDKNARVRGLARSIVLKYEETFDIRQYYLDHMHSDTAVCLYGLGETGTREDCSLIENFLLSDEVSVCRAAMTALMQLNPEKYLSRITDLLEADQPGTVKTAAQLLEKHKYYDCNRIFQILNHAACENSKIKCAQLLFQSSKWKSLFYTLILLGSSYEKLETLCQMQIKRWIMSYNKSFSILSEEDKGRIYKLMEEKAKFLSPETVNHILFLLK